MMLQHEIVLSVPFDKLYSKHNVLSHHPLVKIQIESLPLPSLDGFGARTTMYFMPVFFSNESLVRCLARRYETLLQVQLIPIE